MMALARKFRSVVPTCMLLLAFSTSAVVATVSPSPVFADDRTEAVSQLVTARFNQALVILSDDSLDMQGKEAGFRTIVQEAFYLPAISRFVLGRYWRKASDEEKAEYSKVFEDYVVKTYVQRLASFADVTFTISDVKEAKKDLIVSTIVKRSDGGPDARLDWRLKNVNGDWRVVDVIIEGISMAISQRSEFASIIQQNGGAVSSLIDRLKTQMGS